MQKIRFFLVLLFILNLSTAWAKIFPHVNGASSVDPDSLQKPPGFHIATYANVPNARQLALGPNGIIFVGTYQSDVLAIVPDKAGTHVVTIAKGLTMPAGVAYANGALYIADVSKILRLDNIAEKLNDPPKPVIVVDNLPAELHHGMRYLRFGPDGKLYISIGFPCNVCLKEDARIGTIMRMNPDGTQVEIYARGIRNSMGFDWHPVSKQLWFTDNGRDFLGDDLPPDKLNVAPQLGLNFGFPFYNGKNLPDPVYGKQHPVYDFTPPTLDLPAHVAPLGMAFYTGQQFPTEYRNQLFLAEHGSWNRSKKVGYQVLFVKIDNGKVIEAKPFITGWLQGETMWGRPVDLMTANDGSLLISDDFAGKVYKVTYHE